MLSYRHIEHFGRIRWLRLGPNRGFHSTNYGFVRYENENVYEEKIEFLNRVGIPNTRIWFELNPRPTQANHQEAPAAPRVQRQLEEVASKEQELNEQEPNQRTATLEVQLAESRQLVQDLLNRHNVAQEEAPRACVPLSFRGLQRRLNETVSSPPSQPAHMPFYKNLALPKQTKLRLLNSLIEPISNHPRETENAISGSKSPMVNRSNNSNTSQLRDQLESMLEEQINRQEFLSSFGTLAAILFWNVVVLIYDFI
ncbi:unnamed protein product [Brachionus calyciflorus]|uniref:RRM domain-containing protein n=1 Tax=Brachionus calyciflorus TaxID=104777 RepID=A0A814A7F0_9BILA|nr:unnamed protein product [Brachionus calyciflorus]